MDMQTPFEQVNDLKPISACGIPVVPVILSGGTGTRLWPLSRPDMPKQLLPLCGPEPMVVSTAKRLAGPDCLPPIVVCIDDQGFLVANALAAQSLEKSRLVLQPVGRDTAPAVAVAALCATMISCDCLLVVQPTDHIVADPTQFHIAVQQACRIATRYDKLVVLGARPTRPETGYGYIECSDPLGDGSPATLVKRFVEKPDAERAVAFAQSSAWLWNVGIFVCRASILLDELSRLRPAMLDHCRRAVGQSKSNGTILRLDRESFSAAESISIDHAVMEKSDRLVVVPLECEWTDIGSWAALWGIEQRDGQGNVVLGDVVHLDTEGSYLRSDGRLLVCLGLKNAVVISTTDAMLVADKDRSQEVKTLVETMRTRGRREVQESAMCRRPWGSYETLTVGEEFRVKRIVVDPGAQLSLQLHQHRSEHWVIVRGTALVQVNEDTYLRRENESVFVPQGAKHRIANTSTTPVELIEVQVGSYLGEDDITRLEDVYGRAQPTALVS